MSYIVSKDAEFEWHDLICITIYEDNNAKKMGITKINDFVSRSKLLSKVANMECISDDAVALIRYIVDASYITFFYIEREVKIRLYSGHNIIFEAFDELRDVLYNIKT